ncbi:MORC family CW-type zinc finger protein 4-like [Clarias gariepinus]|uniref:MORC family CW-type zinc finger protein 4-like n=1 Tax=Clarias gariepinus TaxID=13013 RepID=UPI00234DFE83|nr:MORC family CW-type zinc finger protein 4-like [Clarias gariepinus]
MCLLMCLHDFLIFDRHRYKPSNVTKVETRPSGRKHTDVSWVQCSRPECAKWRQLRDGVDPSDLPDDWTCSNNTVVRLQKRRTPWTKRRYFSTVRFLDHWFGLSKVAIHGV